MNRPGVSGPRDRRSVPLARETELTKIRIFQVVEHFRGAGYDYTPPRITATTDGDGVVSHRGSRLPARLRGPGHVGRELGCHGAWRTRPRCSGRRRRTRRVGGCPTWRPARRLLPPFARRGSAIRRHALAARGTPCFVVSSKIRGPIPCLRWLTGTRIGDSRRHSCSVRICPDAQWWVPRSGTAAGTRGRGEP